MNFTQYLKDKIIEEYGSIRRFARIIDIPNTTLTSALNRENGFGKMSMESAFKVCKELELDINEIYNYKIEPLTSNEKKLVDIYKNVSQMGKDLILNHAEMVKEYENNQTTIILPLITETTIPMTELDYYPQAAAMGRNQYVKDAIPDKIIVPTASIPDNTDFVIRVVGDSMEPTFHSGDKLFIQNTQSLNPGDIGAFNIDGTNGKRSW